MSVLNVPVCSHFSGNDWSNDYFSRNELKVEISRHRFRVSYQGPHKYLDGKGTGLLLLGKPTGSQIWAQRSTVHGGRQPREIPKVSAQPFTTESQPEETSSNRPR